MKVLKIIINIILFIIVIAIILFLIIVINKGTDVILNGSTIKSKTKIIPSTIIITKENNSDTVYIYKK